MEDVLVCLGCANELMPLWGMVVFRASESEGELVSIKVLPWAVLHATLISVEVPQERKDTAVQEVKKLLKCGQRLSRGHWTSL